MSKKLVHFESNDLNRQFDEVIRDVNAGSVPSGAIIMFSGEDIPEGWALCDGENGTPDLRDRFIVSAGNTYNEGDTGGEDSVTLAESEIPSHDHGDGSLSTGNDSHSHSGTTGSDSHSHSYNRGDTSFSDHSDQKYDNTTGSGFDLNSSRTTGSDSHSHGFSTDTDTHNHSISGSTANAGGGNSHENRPKYYALAFIMKL